jgi:flagellar hook-associated protein 1 FlgK
MPGLTQTLEIARRAMAAQQAAMAVIGHNIANANSPGYTRQTARLVAEVASRADRISYGNGVSVEAVLRQRDTSLDGTVRHELAAAGHWSQRASILASLEQVLGEPSEDGLGAALDGFWGAWGDLADDPDGTAARLGVREQGRVVVDRLRGLHTRIAQTAPAVDEQLRSQTIEFNRLLGDLRTVSLQINEAELGGASANDLLDRRDLLLDQINAIAPVRFVTGEGGSFSLRVGGKLVLDRTLMRPLEAAVETVDGNPRVRLQMAGGDGVTIEGGAIGALVDLRDETVPQLLGELDLLAADLIQQVNAVHRNGPSRNAFFEGSAAGDIRLAAAIEADVRAIDSSTTGLPGDNDIALAMTALRDARFVDGGSATVGEYWAGMVTRLGLASREAEFQSESLDATVQSLQARRSETGGVSLDEEMASLLEMQQAYIAAVRLFEMTSEMMDVLLGV